jgi:hypothetical protein
VGVAFVCALFAFAGSDTWQEEFVGSLKLISRLVVSIDK